MRDYLIRDLQKNLNLVQKLGVDKNLLLAQHPNPLRLLEEDEFGRNQSADKTYTMAAIARALAAKVRFWTTSNSLHDMTKMVLTVKCPRCHRVMEMRGGSGALSKMTYTYRCEHDKMEIGLTLDDTAFTVIPPEADN